ncbi:MAG: polymerase sigma-54 factor RpoN [Labilithrix sp.]|nr:polymerase sigma-54 factor RpoN [Labilithrix sp.]
MGRIVPLRPRREPAAAVAGERLEERTDEELMALVRLGTRAAFRVLVVRHAEKVAGFCARITGDRAGAYEVAQEVWLAVWDARERWEPRSKFASWLYTIAFTRSRNHARSRRRMAAVFAAEPLEPDAAARADELEIDRLLERERQERLFQALGDLPPAMREAVILRFVDELSYEEMERVLSSNASTLRSRVHHALQRLKERLGKEQR